MFRGVLHSQAGASGSSGGTVVNSVTGTPNRITVTPTIGNVVVDIASTYVGQTSITTLGTITTGTWHGAVITGQYGGTGVANTGQTINLGSPSTGYVLTSDVSGNASWQAPASGGGITTLAANSGSATGSTVTISASGNGSSVTTSASGATLTLNLSDANTNIFLGVGAGNGSISGNLNVAIGNLTGSAMTSGSSNVYIGQYVAQTGRGGSNSVGIGNSALQQNVGGDANVCIGSGSLSQQTGAGAGNICLGYNSGYNCTSTESTNIFIGSRGVNGQSNSTIIGYLNQSSGLTSTQTKCYIDGIAGVTVSSTAAVLVNTSTGQLGTVISSARFKENIQDMDDASSFIHKLRPVKFTLKAHPEYGQQTGLIAEEVYKVAPQLVIVDVQGRPDSVKYHDLPVLLLNELKKLKNELNEIKSQLDSYKNDEKNL